MSEGDVALACMRAFVDGLACAGVRHACVSPGSRSTPLALALARDGRIRVHVHLDERASAFFALGLARAVGAPVVVASTSGTAAAEFFPAVVEASMSRVPLIALTADRPPELRGVGANQTIDQVDLFGRYPVWSIDAPVPKAGEHAATEWSTLAVRAFRKARRPGPVHVNLSFRMPLVPAGEPVSIGSPSAASPEPSGAARRVPSGEEVSALAEAVGGGRRGLVYVGELREPAPAVGELAEALGWPLVAEPHSGLRRPGALSLAPLLLANDRFAVANAPDLVLQVGAAPTSRAALALVARVEELAIVDPDDRIGDPHRRARPRVVGDAGDVVRSLLGAAPRRTDPAWLGSWREADARARAAVDALLDSWEAPFEGRVARDLADSIPDGSTLVVGSSLPIRDLDAYMRPRHGLRVLANRGASGIDGFVSTALGVAASGVPTFSLMGDLTFLHDAGSLLWSARRGLDAVLVVVNNGGGRIFSILEQRELPELEELFVTPHGMDLSAVCAAAGAGHARVTRSAALIPAIRAASDAGGVQVVEVLVDPAENERRRAEVAATVGDALRA